MKNKTFRIPVAKGNICILSDPTGRGHSMINALVKISDLPLDLPLEVNPRAQNTDSRVARQIQHGLLESASEFHLLNRGMTVTAFDAKYDAKAQMLDIELNSYNYGVVDGGHTYAVIRKNLTPYLAPTNGEIVEERPEFLDSGFVRMEVMLGVKDDLLLDIAQSRNTSAQVRDESLANLSGSFDFLKEALAKTPYANQIAYKENEDDTIYPIDVREIVALLTLFHPDFQENEKPPILGYTSKGRCLELLRNKPEGFQQLKPIIPDVLRLYDYIHLKFADLYKTIGGFGSLEEDELKRGKQKGVKLAKVIGVKEIKEGFPLYYLGQNANYLFPDGWLFPVLSSLRALVSYKTLARWKAKPETFFDKYGRALVKMTLETSISEGRNPNAVGKNKAHWIQLNAHVQNAYLKLLNVDMEREVEVK